MLDRPPIWIHESELARRVRPDCETALVQRDVTRVADEHQVSQRSRSTLRPMVDVVRVHEGRVGTAREAAATITKL